MRTAAIYTTPAQSDFPDREDLIYAEVQRSLTAIAGSQRQVFAGPRTSGTSSLPGLAFDIRQTPIIALGLEAHIALADVSKRTLIARHLDLENTTEDADEDIAQLVWSSINTTRMVVVGEPAWESVQLLPVADRCFHDAPPLPMRQADTGRPSILVIDHEGNGARALSLVETLEQAALGVESIGLSAKEPVFGQQSPWAATAWIHIHVGAHTLKTELPRLVDSWRNGRLTIHLVDRAALLERNRSTPDLAVQDQENGFVCFTPNEIVAVCRDLLEDPVLRHKLVSVGHSSVTSFLKAWRAIAEDLLS